MNKTETLLMILNLTLIVTLATIIFVQDSQLQETKKQFKAFRLEAIQDINDRDDLIDLQDDITTAKGLYIEELTQEVVELRFGIARTRADISNLTKQLIDLRVSYGLSSGYLDDRWGTYYPDSMDIEVYAGGLTIDEAKETAIHEIGHYVWFELMSSSDRRDYELVYNNAEQFVSVYAETNVLEDFAETFAIGHRCYLDVSSVPLDRQEFFQEFS